MGKEDKRNREAGKGPEEEEDEDEDDVLRWQVPFVMGRLCAQLGKDPRAVLEKLAEALRLAQVVRRDFVVPVCMSVVYFVRLWHVYCCCRCRCR